MKWRKEKMKKYGPIWSPPPSTIKKMQQSPGLEAAEVGIAEEAAAVAASSAALAAEAGKDVLEVATKDASLAVASELGKDIQYVALGTPRAPQDVPGVLFSKLNYPNS